MRAWSRERRRTHIWLVFFLDSNLIHFFRYNRFSQRSSSHPTRPSMPTRNEPELHSTVHAPGDETSASMAGLYALLVGLCSRPTAPLAPTRNPAGRCFLQSSTVSPGDAEYEAPMPAVVHRSIYNDSQGRDLHTAATAQAAAATAQAAAAFAACGSHDHLLVARRMQRAVRPVRHKLQSAI